MQQLPNDFFTELTYSTIQKETRWMEYQDNMEDFILNTVLQPEEIEAASVFLCGYFPLLNMELAILASSEQGKGTFYSLNRDNPGDIRIKNFILSDGGEDFAVNMLMYTAATQVLLREKDEAYHQLMESKSQNGCAGCSGCK